MPEYAGGRTFYSAEENAARGVIASDEERARTMAALNEFGAQGAALRAEQDDPGSIDDIDPWLREQLELRARDDHAGTPSDGWTHKGGQWFDADGNLVYTQGPDGWYDTDGVLVYDLSGNKMK